MQDCHLRKEPYVTGFTFVSLLLHDEVQKPPSPERSLRSEFPPAERKKSLHKKSSRKIFRDDFYFMIEIHYTIFSP